MTLQLFSCPCCQLPTLPSRGDFAICIICWWEDDGQNDDDADVVTGGPNYQYSLTHARKNFFNHGDMYDCDDQIDVVANPTPERKILLDYAFSVLSGKEALDRKKLVALLRREHLALG